MNRIYFLLALLLGSLSYASAQSTDSVDVTFYYKTSSNLTAVFLPGEFNNWGNNVGGVISLADPSRMSKDPTTGIWWKTVRLHVGGRVGGGVAGGYQYKINENGSSSGWLADPLNPRQNAGDNGNSIIYVNNPTIFRLLPNAKSAIVNQQYPIISTYVFPAIGSTIDTTALALSIDTTSYPISSAAYNTSTYLLSFKSPAPLQNGTRTVRISARHFGGPTITDSSTFAVQAGAIQILNHGGFTTVKDSIIINLSVEDTTIHFGQLVHNGVDTQSVIFTAGTLPKKVGLTDGLNTFRAIAKDSTAATIFSSLFSATRFINHSPDAVITVVPGGSSLTLSATNSTDPDSGETALLTYLWSVDPNSPESIGGIAGANTATLNIVAPKMPGEYYFGLIASDPEGHGDTTRSFFTLNSDGSVTLPAMNSNPQWARMGRIYELFFNSFTPQQTINAAAQKLDYLHRLGVNILWIMPIMKNNARIDNGPGPGYNIVDFYTVAPEYGTNADFKNFVSQAHQMGIKVILDVTPNHTSYNHPFVLDARTYGANSFYWNFYEHQLILNSNYHPDLGEAITNDNFVYYGAFGDQILNYNWADEDARAYMIGVYTWWVKEMGLDGYRFDVYWGPHARANGGNGGELEMGVPVRAALKHIKPDVFILGEASGTGGGTEAYYADRNGGADAAYDWNLLHQVVTPYNISNLNSYVTNFGGDTMGFVPGPNARFMRFLENHDEDRIAYVYNSYAKTMPMGTMIFTVPGMPMIYSGQEVGFGLGISNYDQRRRGIIDWNSAGKTLLSPHYQRLAWIRATFPAFSTQIFNRIATGNGLVYAYTRPFQDQNGIAVENFSGTPATGTIVLRGAGQGANVRVTGGPINGKTYFLNDVYNDTSYAVSFKNDTLGYNVSLPAYGSAVFLLSDSVFHLTVPSLTSVSTTDESSLPHAFALEQNFPNPFNPVTNITFSLPQRSIVKLGVYNILGQEVVELVNGSQTAGKHLVTFDGSRLASGVYFYRLEAGSYLSVKKMLLVK